MPHTEMIDIKHNKNLRYFPNKANYISSSRPYTPKSSGDLESLFKDKMTGEELKNLEKLEYKPVFKNFFENCFRTCTIRVPSGQQKIYAYDEKEKIYIKMG